MIEKMEAVDSSTVKFSLSTPFADMPLQLMDYRLRIIPEGSGDSIATSGIGTGPFKLVSFDAAGVTKLEANMDYWEGAPGVAKMEITGTLIPYHVSKLYVMNSRVSGIDAVENHTIRWNKVTVK